MYPHYNPYLLFSLIATYYCTRPFLGAKTIQNYICISNTYLTLLAYLPFCYSPPHLQTIIYSYLFQYSTAYFLTDTYLVLLHHRDQWFFIFHHAASLWLLFTEHKVSNLQLKMPVYFYLELSNAFLVLYGMYHTKPIKKLLTAFYVPYRLILVPYYGTQLLFHTLTTIPYLWLPILALSLMSIFYALKLAHSTPLNYLTLLPIYLNIELLYHILPHAPPHPLYYLTFIPYSLYSLYQTTKKLIKPPQS
jgi:hypothetical protein